MHFDIGHPIKGRTRSVQLEKNIDYTAAEPAKAESVQECLSSPPVPAARSSSLPAGKENIGSVRQYRSMLDVEGPPKLGPVKTFTYDELYVDNAKLASCQAPPFCKIGLRHLRLSTLAGSLSLFWRAHAVPEANYGDGSCERRSHRPPSEGVSGPSSQWQANTTRRSSVGSGTIV